MNRHVTSTCARGQTFDNDRYGPSARGRDQTYNDGHNSNAGDYSSSDDEIRSTRGNHRSGPPPPYDMLHRERRGLEGLSRPGLNRPRGQTMHSESDSDEAPRRGMRTTTHQTNTHQTRRIERGTTEIHAGRHDARVGDNVHHPNCPARRGTLRGDVSSDSESELDPRESLRRPGMATRVGGGRGVDISSRYGTRGPQDHVRGPRRTGDRIEYEDDSEVDPVFDVGYRERRRF